MSAMFIPFGSILRACSAISHGKFGKETDLERAARVGALCVVARSKDWKPLAGEEIEGCKTTGISSSEQSNAIEAHLKLENYDDPIVVSLIAYRIHGQYSLPPEGYELQIVPDYIEISPRHSGSLELSNQHNILKYAASLIQLAFACITLYRVSGNQLDQYGYAAYGLTVVPYAIMSFVNLCANICSPDYPSLYMVRSEVMDEAEQRGGWFDGTVGRIHVGTDIGLKLRFENGVKDMVKFADPGGLSAEHDKTNPLVILHSLGRHVSRTPSSAGFWLATVIFLIALAAPYAIIAGLTGFDAAKSTSGQRGWTMSWLVLGQVLGVFWGTVQFATVPSTQETWIGLIFFLILLCAAAPIGGFVTVAREIIYLGTCTLVG